jgi:DNA-binding IclR family transcriptional regulator
MPLTEIPEPVRRFIVEAVDSVPELEALLLLRAHADRTWSVEDAGARLYVSPTMASHLLNALAARGLLERDGERYRYGPARPELDHVVGDLAATYATKLIAVTRLIHAKPAASVRQFADAFRLRKEP